MAMLSTRSWWLKSRVLLWWRVSISLVLVYPPQQQNNHLSEQNVRKSRHLLLPTPSLVVLPPFSSMYAPPHHQLWHCILEHRSSSLWHRCPTTQLNKLRRHFAPRSHTSSYKSISSRNCKLTPRNASALSHWTCPTSPRSFLPFIPKILRVVLTIQSQYKRFEFNVTEGRC